MRALQKQVGERIRKLREEKGISQEALAGVCNLHRTYIGLIERGQRNLSLSTIEVVAEGLGVGPVELFTGLVSKTTPQRTKKLGQVPSLTEIAAHIATVRRILIEAKLTDERRYEILYSAALRKTDD